MSLKLLVIDHNPLFLCAMSLLKILGQILLLRIDGSGLLQVQKSLLQI
jgi:hypothetical protein